MSSLATRGALYHIIAHMKMVEIYANTCTRALGSDEMHRILDKPMTLAERIESLESLKARLQKENPSEEGQANPT